MSFSNVMEALVLKHLFGKDFLAQPTIFVGLCTGNPAEFCTGGNCVEVPDAFNYARALTVSDDWFVSDVATTASNFTPILFPEAIGGDWGTVSHFVLLDSGVYGEGNVIVYGELEQPFEITSGIKPRFLPNEINVSLE